MCPCRPWWAAESPRTSGKSATWRPTRPRAGSAAGGLPGCGESVPGGIVGTTPHPARQRRSSYQEVLMSIRSKVAVVTLGVAVPAFAAFPLVFPPNPDGPEVTGAG